MTGESGANTSDAAAAAPGGPADPVSPTSAPSVPASRYPSPSPDSPPLRPQSLPPLRPTVVIPPSLSSPAAASAPAAAVYRGPPTVSRWGLDRSMPAAPSPVSPRQPSNVLRGADARMKGTYKLNTRPRVLRAAGGMAVWACLMCALAATGGWLLIGMGEDPGGWEEWMAWGRWFDGDGNTRVTLGVAGYCLRSLLRTVPDRAPVSLALVPGPNLTLANSYQTVCSFYPQDMPTSPLAPAFAPIYFPFRGQPQFYSSSYLVAMPALFLAHVCATVGAIILPIICAGPDARRFAKGLGWGALAALLSGFGMTVAFVETWRQGMANLASIGQIPGIVLDGQQFQYAGGLGAAIAAILTSAFGVQLGFWRGFQRPGKKRRGNEDGLYDWMD
ncbi:hypothetical protein DFJ74DRAFT_653584 [Hyaloraphidium curvatum]|nr:hypothetical protein DFJ74DRAFT_653584 [Hyaloraphidium curvatum]